jgi:multiple sugar transport system substrate-binding protein
MLKKVFSLCLIVVLAASLFGCSSISETTGQSKKTGSDKKGVVELTLLTHYSAAQEKELKKYIDIWNKENPKIQVKHKSIADFAQLLPTIMAEQTSGQIADILHVYSLWGGQLAKSNVLAQPPADVLDDIKNNYADSAIKGSTVNGQIVGYPTEVETYALFYNKKLLADAGFTNPPKTWDELYDMSKKITKRDGKGKVLVEGFGLTSGWDSAVVHPYLSLVHSAGGSFLNEDNTKVTLNSEAGLKALEFEQRLIKDGITDPSINVLQAFPSERVAMTINAGWWNGSLKAAMKDRYKNIGVAPIPSPDGKSQGTVSYSFFYGVNNRSQHQKEAWEFLKWLNSKSLENGATAESNFLVSQGFIPSRNSDIKALEKELATPNNQPFIDALKYAVPEPNVLEGQKIKTLLQKEIESVWSGKKQAKDAIDSATSLINQELGK